MEGQVEPANQATVKFNQALEINQTLSKGEEQGRTTLIRFLGGLTYLIPINWEYRSEDVIGLKIFLIWRRQA